MTSMIDFCADIQVPECMNDIINQVETREWNRVNEHRDRLVKKMKKEKTKVKEMKDDWEIATEKIAQENSDLHNEIKKLKNEMKLLKDVNKSHLQRLEHMEKSKSGIRYKELLDENEKLQNRIEDAEQKGFDEGRDQYQVDSEYLDEKEDEIEKLKSSLMNSSGSFKCEKCNIHLTQDDVYMSVDECEGKLLCESCWED